MNDLAPPIEPLSDLSWQRVEKRLFAALDCDAAVPAPARASRTRWQPWAIGGAAALIAAAIVLFAIRSRDDTTPAVARDGEPAPSRVVTQDAPSEVSFGEATITVAADSALTLYGDAEHGVVTVLERGSASFAVAPREDRPPFLVQAGDVAVRVIGTRFSVSRSGDAAKVEVTRGHVEVVSRGQRVQVRAGESWSSTGDREAVGSGQDTNQGGTAAAPYSPSGPPDDGGPGDARSDNGSAHDGLPWEGQSSAGAAGDQHPRPRQRTSRSDPGPPPPTLDDRARFQHAAALESSDPHAALAVYRDLLKGQGPWAANALFAAGRLAVELGQSDAAVYLRAYLHRFPDGANASDARTLLAQLGG